MNDFEEFIEFINFARRHRDPGPRRYLRDLMNPFEKYSNREFYSRYRFTPYTVRHTLLPIFEADLARPSRRGLPFPPETMLLLTLRFYATGSYQKLDGDTMEICQQSVSRIVATVSQAIARKMKDFIKFPSLLNEVKQKFYEIAQFPGIIGCIDCTHIKIRSPGSVTSEVYRNRKGWFSLNVQAVTGPNLEFFDLIARWPGSSHDSFIYNCSSVKQRLVGGDLPGILLGDSGYAVSNVLLTPFLAPNSRGQENYNKSQIKTRNTVERTFGVWKRRFPCLQVGMNLKKETVVAVICACAALHNISLQVNDIMPDDDDDQFDISGSDSQNEQIQDNPNSNGFIARQALVERFFSA